MEWRADDYDFSPSQLAAERRAARPSGGLVRCQVEGCPNDLASLRPFYQRLRICEAHAKASYVTDASGQVQRFCQQCSKLQPLSAFQGERRSCAISLDKRRARRTVSAAQELKLVDVSGILGGGAEGETGPGRRKRQGRTRLYDSGSGSGSPGGSEEQTTALPSQLKSKLRRVGHPGGRSPDSGGSGTHSAAAGPSPLAQGGLGVPGFAAGTLPGWHAGGGAMPGMPTSPWMSPALFGGAGVPPLPLAAQHSSATSPAMLLELQRLDATHTMRSGMPAHPAAPGGPAAPPGSAADAAAAADAAFMHATDLDLLLALGPEDLADCLLEFHDGEASAAAAATMADTALDLLPGNPFLDGLPPAAADGGSSATAAAGKAAPLASPQQPGNSAGSGSGERAPATEVEGSTGHAFLGPPTSGVRALFNASGNAAGGSTGHPSTASAPQQPASSSPSAAANAAASAGSAGAAGLPGHEGSSDVDAWLTTFSFKLFDCTPDTLPKDLRAQLQTALALAPSVMHASMRAGCVCLTTTILLNRAELERLEGSVGGLPGAVASAVGKVHPGKLLCHAGSRLSVADGTAGTVSHLRLPAEAASICAQLAAPRLATPAVVVCGASDSLQLVLTGPGIASPGAVLHCRSRGRHQVVAVLRARRSAQAWLEALPPGRRAPSVVDEPGTPPSADARPADLNDSADEGERPSTRAASPDGDREEGAPTAAALAFQALELGYEEDALLVELAAPEGGWGLLELEVASGPVLSAATPLLVLPWWAGAAAQELACLSSVGAAGGLEPAAFLQHLGFLLHTAEASRQPGAPPLHPVAAERAARLSRRISLACDAHGWLATARLLLPTLAIGSSASAPGSASRSPGKASPLADEPALVAVVRSSKSASPAEQEQLEAMLGRLALAEEQEEAAAAAAEAAPRPLDVRAELAAQLSDWFWTGCNLAAGLASATLLVRNLGGL